MSGKIWFRFGANWFLPTVLIFTYLHAMFVDPTQFVGDQSPTEPGSIPKAHPALRQAGRKARAYISQSQIFPQSCLDWPVF